MLWIVDFAWKAAFVVTSVFRPGGLITYESRLKDGTSMLGMPFRQVPSSTAIY
jgi:hypothetical protein